MATEKWAELKAQAQAGDAEAQWEIGSWLQDGLVDPDGVVLAEPDQQAAAVRWFRKSAVGGNAYGQVHLGNCLSEGHKDAEALLWYKRAHRQGVTFASTNIAVLYRRRGNHRRAMFWFQRALAAGDLGSLIDIGRLYLSGGGARCDPTLAVRCFRKAIAGGPRANIAQWEREEAMILLGVAFHEGRGVKRSDDQALKWLVRANKDDDHADARDLIKRIEKNLRKAART